MSIADGVMVLPECIRDFADDAQVKVKREKRFTFAVPEMPLKRMRVIKEDGSSVTSKTD